jgi:hypothetical protein
MLGRRWPSNPCSEKYAVFQRTLPLPPDLLAQVSLQQQELSEILIAVVHELICFLVLLKLHG